MGQADYLAEGSWNAQCFECDRKFKANEMRKTWQGYWVCFRCWRPRQPQDFVRGIPEHVVPPWVQPPGADRFASYCTPNGISAIPGTAIPGCAIPGYIHPAYNPEVT